MNPDHLEFNSVHEEDFLDSLSKLFFTNPQNGVLTIPEQYGHGTLTHKKINEGLTLLFWDFHLTNGLTFSKKIKPKDVEGRTLVITYLLMTDKVNMVSQSLKQTFSMKGKLNILFMPDDTDMDFEVVPGIPVRAVSISIKPDWLRKEYGETDPSFAAFMNRILEQEKPPVFMESSTPEDFRMLEELIDCVNDPNKNCLHFKSKTLTLINDFFSHIYNRPHYDVLDSRILHFDKMKKVKDIINMHLEMTLPSIEMIAQQVNLSVSTLKRHFKVAYGMGIYEYYLEQKMEHAKRLLMERDVTVNEVAAILRYEKVSSFIDSFKKHQGFSPGFLRKRS